MKAYQRAYVEISNICNLKCSFCPEVERQKHVMDAALFEKVIAETAPLAQEVCLHLMGEPLGHPELARFLEICAQHNLPVNMTTNGVLLNEARRALLLQNVVRQVNISVHSFAANFGASDPTPYLARIFKFTRQALSDRPDLYINYRLWDLADPYSLTPENATIRDAIESEFNFKIDAAKVDVRRRKSHPVTGRVNINFDSRFEWPTLAQLVRTETGFCHGLSSHFGVHADGTVVPCCLDKEAVIALGNCRDTTLATLLNGERASAMRQGFARGHLVEDLCKRCTFIERFDRKAQRISNEVRA